MHLKPLWPRPHLPVYQARKRYSVFPVAQAPDPGVTVTCSLSLSHTPPTSLSQFCPLPTSTANPAAPHHATYDLLAQSRHRSLPGSPPPPESVTPWSLSSQRNPACEAPTSLDFSLLSSRVLVTLPVTPLCPPPCAPTQDSGLPRRPRRRPRGARSHSFRARPQRHQLGEAFPEPGAERHRPLGQPRPPPFVSSIVLLFVYCLSSLENSMRPWSPLFCSLLILGARNRAWTEAPPINCGDVNASKYTS